jgi:hypothetical protein
LESEGAEGLVWPAAATAATEIIKNTRKILFMLDLTALERVEKPQLLGC